MGEDLLHVLFLDSKRSRAWLSPAAIQPWVVVAAHHRPATSNLSAEQARRLAAAEAEAAYMLTKSVQERLTAVRIGHS